MLGIINLLLPGITKVLDKLIPDADARSKAQEEITRALIEKQGEVDKAIAEAAKAQAEVNLKEAESPSLFVAGWRPFIGWVCGIGFAYNFLFQPLVSGVALQFGGIAFPVLDVGALMTLVTGMLGLGAYRTYEKVQGVERSTMQTPVVKKK